MRVTRLEIFGFKSFVERFTLNFDRNLIGIVGPNGCGKSNVVDALRWVLGETYAKQLRGVVLDDLIFNGSESRRPLGMAEVSVTIRPDEDWVQTAKDRLGDVEEFKSAEEIVAASTADSDSAVTGAETNGSSPATNGQTPEEDLTPRLLREIPGLFGAAEVQFTRRLYRSGESEYFINRVPCRLRDMTDIYRLIGLGARGLSIVQQGEIGQFIAKKPIERRELLEEAAGIAGFRTRMESASKKLEQTTENISRLRDIILEVEKQVKVLQRQAKRARERNELKATLMSQDFNLFKARLVQLEMQQKEQQELQEKLTVELESAKADLSMADAAYEEQQASVEGLDIEISDARRELDAQQALLMGAREQQRSIEVELARVEARMRAAEQAVSRLADRERQVEAERERRGNELPLLMERRERAETQREAAEKELNELQARRDTESSQATESEVSEPPDLELRQRIEELTAQIGAAENMAARCSELQGKIREEERSRDREREELTKHRMQITSAESELRSLQSQLDALTEEVVKRTGAKEGVDKLAAEGVVRKILLAGVKCDEPIQRSLAAVLGERAHFVVSGDPEQLGERFVSSGKNSGGKIGVIDAAAIGSENSERALEQHELNAAPSAVWLLEQLQVEDEFQGPVKVLLGNFLLVDSLAEAFALNRANRVEQKPLRYLVSRAGEIVTPWGWYTTEGKGAAFSFTRRIEEQTLAREKLRGELPAREQTLNDAEQRVSQLRADLATAHALRDSLLAIQSELGRLVGKERELEKVRREAILRAERERREALLREEREVQAKLRTAMGEFSSAQSALEMESRKREDMAREIAAIQMQREEASGEHQALIGEFDELGARLVAHTEGQRGTVERIEEGCRELASTISDVESRRAALRKDSHELSQRVQEARRAVERLQEKGLQASLVSGKSELEENAIWEELRRNYPEEGETFKLQDADRENILQEAQGQLGRYITSIAEEATKLRRRIEREGDVDPQSIELYDQESARLEGLQTQLVDLDEAHAILEKTIRRLKELSRTRFMATFEDVSRRFAELIPRLFGGGAGHMELINPDDPLTSGVQLVVRPPGKKVSNMELMSGGEKALVAVSVLVSVFLHRPSPICVLDEVDAPLDDANLERFLDLVREISSSTQFLIITHNKLSMAAADRLVGITMEERGVTKALTVTLQEAELAVANA